MEASQIVPLLFFIFVTILMFWWGWDYSSKSTNKEKKSSPKSDRKSMNKTVLEPSSKEKTIKGVATMEEKEILQKILEAQKIVEKHTIKTSNNVAFFFWITLISILIVAYNVARTYGN